jgi:hypothetical protein
LSFGRKFLSSYFSQGKGTTLKWSPQDSGLAVDEKNDTKFYKI